MSKVFQGPEQNNDRLSRKFRSDKYNKTWTPRKSQTWKNSVVFNIFHQIVRQNVLQNVWSCFNQGSRSCQGWPKKHCVLQQHQQWPASICPVCCCAGGWPQNHPSPFWALQVSSRSTLVTTLAMKHARVLKKHMLGPKLSKPALGMKWNECLWNVMQYSGLSHFGFPLFPAEDAKSYLNVPENTMSKDGRNTSDLDFLALHNQKSGFLGREKLMKKWPCNSWQMMQPEHLYQCMFEASSEKIWGSWSNVDPGRHARNVGTSTDARSCQRSQRCWNLEQPWELHARYAWAGFHCHPHSSPAPGPCRRGPWDLRHQALRSNPAIRPLPVQLTSHRGPHWPHPCSRQSEPHHQPWETGLLHPARVSEDPSTSAAPHQLAYHPHQLPNLPGHHAPSRGRAGWRLWVISSWVHCERMLHEGWIQSLQHTKKPAAGLTSALWRLNHRTPSQLAASTPNHHWRPCQTSSDASSLWHFVASIVSRWTGPIALAGANVQTIVPLAAPSTGDVSAGTGCQPHPFQATPWRSLGRSIEDFCASAQPSKGCHMVALCVGTPSLPSAWRGPKGQIRRRHSRVCQECSSACASMVPVVWLIWYPLPKNLYMYVYVYIVL